MPPKRRNNRSLKRSTKNVRNMRLSKIPFNIQTIFYNQNYLYVISLISILYFLINAINHNYITLISFMVIGVFTFATYSKNMALVLTLACIASFMIYVFGSIFGFFSPQKKEGLTNNNKITPPQKKPDNTNHKKKTTEKLSSLQPAPVPMGRHSDFDVDLSSTLQQSYGMLNDLLDNDGISNLTGETKRLISEQKKLFQSMNSMTPLISQAKEMLGMFNTDDFKQMEGLARRTLSGQGIPFREGLEKKVGGSSGVPNPKPFSEDLDMRSNFGY